MSSQRDDATVRYWCRVFLLFFAAICSAVLLLLAAAIILRVLT